MPAIVFYFLTAGHAERMARIRADLVREFGEAGADEILGKQANG
jgi:hypothetical protein